MQSYAPLQPLAESGVGDLRSTVEALPTRNPSATLTLTPTTSLSTMSPPVSSNGKRGSSRPAATAAAAPSKKSVSRSSGSGHNGGTGGGGGGAGHKRSASAAAIEDEHQAAAAASKRTKRNASAKKSLREEELGVGAELAEDDMIEAGDEATLDEEGDEGDGGVTRCVCGEDSESRTLQSLRRR